MIDEAAFLSEISELLGECVESHVPTDATRQELAVSAEHDMLLVASHQLVAETEALLSSCGASTSVRTAASDGTKTLERNHAVAERRKERNANAAKRRLKYCKKIKNERELLKQQESELSAELAELRAMQSENELILERTKSMPVWRAIATRQLQSRLVAQEERHRLREAVAAHTKLLQELGLKVQQHLNGPNNAVHGGGAGLPLEPSDIQLFERYQQEVETAYDQVDSVLQEWGVDDAPLTSFCPDPKRLRDGEFEYYENLALQFVPFDYKQTSDAIWQSMCLLHKQKDRQHYETSDPQDTRALKFRVAGQANSPEPSNLLIRMVIRKRTQGGRTVILWRAHTQGEGELSGLQANETGWSIVRPADAKTKSAVGMPTAILTFIRFVPSGSTPGLRKQDESVGRFLQLSETAGNEDGSDVVRMMESLLLDGSRASRPLSSGN